MQGTRRDVLRTGVAATATAGFPLLAGCTLPSRGDESTTVPADDVTLVEVGPDGQYSFRPGTQEPLSIGAGSRVRFVWHSDTHNVHVRSQPASANWQGHDAVEDEGFSTEATFTVPGTYEFVCEPHEPLGMVGTIVVDRK